MCKSSTKANNVDNYNFFLINDCKYILKISFQNLQKSFFNHFVEIVFANENIILKKMICLKKRIFGNYDDDKMGKISNWRI
jgi:hypothetical protein